LKELKAGHMLAGRYEVVRTLGSSGLGSVYEVRGPLKERLAAKVLIETKLVREGFGGDFVKSAKAWSALRHPNLTAVIEAGESPEGLFSVMEMSDGKDLGSLLDIRGRMEWVHAKPVFVQACSALSAIHGAGIVHGDLSPNELFLAEIWGGMALKLLPSSKMQPANTPAPDKVGYLIGVLAYVAPEQLKLALGEPLILDGRIDIYALGMVLHRALSGRSVYPEDCTNWDVLHAKTERLPPAPSELVPGLSSEVDALVMRALQIDPGKRFQTAAEFRAAIESA